MSIFRKEIIPSQEITLETLFNNYNTYYFDIYLYKNRKYIKEFLLSDNYNDRILALDVILKNKQPIHYTKKGLFNYWIYRYMLWWEFNNINSLFIQNNDINLFLKNTFNSNKIKFEDIFCHCFPKGIEIKDIIDYQETSTQNELEKLEKYNKMEKQIGMCGLSESFINYFKTYWTFDSLIDKNELKYWWFNEYNLRNPFYNNNIFELLISDKFTLVYFKIIDNVIKSLYTKNEVEDYIKRVFVEVKKSIENNKESRRNIGMIVENLKESKRKRDQMKKEDPNLFKKMKRISKPIFSKPTP